MLPPVICVNLVLPTKNQRLLRPIWVEAKLLVMPSTICKKVYLGPTRYIILYRIRVPLSNKGTD